MYKAMKKKEEGKLLYLIHQGFMNKLYNYYLALNLQLLVSPLATATPQISIDLILGSSLKKSKKTLPSEIKISLINLYTNMRRSK